MIADNGMKITRAIAVTLIAFAVMNTFFPEFRMIHISKVRNILVQEAGMRIH